MPLAEDIDNDPLGVESLRTKRKKRGNRMVTELDYSKDLLPPVVASRQDVPASSTPQPQNLQEDNAPFEPPANVLPHIDFSIPDVKKTMTQQEYVRQFTTRKVSFIQTLLARNAFPSSTGACSQCGILAGFYRCRSCHSGPLLCRGCIRQLHRCNPFHKIEHWNGDFFQKASLWQVGLRLVIPAHDNAGCRCIKYRASLLEGQEIARDATRASRPHPFMKRKSTEDSQGDTSLNPEERFTAMVPDLMDVDNQSDAGDHDNVSETVVDSEPGLEEDNPPDDDIYADYEDGERLGKGIPRDDGSGNRFVVVIDSSGMHHLPLLLCNCNFRPTELQVLDCVSAGLLPASYKTISTLFTESCLDDFRLSNLEAKITPNRYHNILQRKTNSIFPQSAPTRYAEVRRMTREWRSIKQEIIAGIHMPEPPSPEATSNAGSFADLPQQSSIPPSAAIPPDAGIPPAVGGMPPAAGIPHQQPPPDAAAARFENGASAPVHAVPLESGRREFGPEKPPRTKPVLAMFCPACPQPGINLPDNWENTIAKWLLARHLTMDGNFSADHIRQKGGNTDLWLLDGLGHFCERHRYQNHLAIAKEIRTNAPCEHTFRAIGLGSLTRTDCDVTGIGAAACARHGCFCPPSVVDLQKGERQMNMDYCLCEALNNTRIAHGATVFTWYDIWCQYAIHLMERVRLNPYLHIPDGIKLDGGIGLFHVHGHADQCFHRFAPYFVPKTGIVDGEVLETLWSVLNNISRSTRTATLAHREEILNDAMNDSNWKKWIKMVPRLVRKFHTAVEQNQEQRLYWDNLTAQSGKVQTDKWTAEIEQAERDRTGFDAKVMDIMKSNTPKPKGRAEIHFDLNEANPGSSADTAYLSEGLHLEEEQLSVGIRIARMGAYPSSTQKKEATSIRNALLLKIQRFHALSAQMLGVDVCDLFPERRPYIPVFQTDDEEGVAVDPSHSPDDNQARPAIAYSAAVVGTHAELIFLMLPSGIPPRLLAALISPSSPTFNARIAALSNLELKLRIGQANDALQDIRTSISRISFQYTNNYRAADRTMIKTRSRTAIDSLHKNVSHSRRVYNLCRERMCIIGLPQSELSTNFQPIRNNDVQVSTAIRSPNERGASQQKLSWIFQTEMDRMGDMSNQDYLWEYMRVHWLRARAMAMRWEEELELVKHEMHWTWICYHNRSKHWDDVSSISKQQGLPGHTAYAKKQAYLWRKMAEGASVAFKGANSDFVAST